VKVFRPERGPAARSAVSAASGSDHHSAPTVSRRSGAPAGSSSAPRARGQWRAGARLDPARRAGGSRAWAGGQGGASRVATCPACPAAAGTASGKGRPAREGNDPGVSVGACLAGAPTRIGARRPARPGA
jgi:hypothetical protein